MFSPNLLCKAVSNPRCFSNSAIKSADFTHAVIGGGAVGLAIARQLQRRDGATSVLIERHGSVGTETSSRNSEVIHAGMYYGPTSLKTKLCIRGKRLLYELCERQSIPHNNCGKWIVAQDEQQREQLDKIHDFCKTVEVPTRFVPGTEAKRREPDVRAVAGVLESTTTGILDSHAFMQHLQGAFEDSGGICAFQSAVTRIIPLRNGADGWEIWTKSPHDEEESHITAETLINSAGLFAIPLQNTIMPPARRRTPFYAKGSYFSYSASRPKPTTLVYPAPKPGLGGLGTHLTLDMGGRVRFGPDVEWVDDPTDYRPNAARLPAALDEIATYLPGIDRGAVALDYCGIRPKLARAGAVATAGNTFQDFYIVKEDGFDGFVNLLAIESPGLTSSLAIAEEVERLLYGAAADPVAV